MNDIVTRLREATVPRLEMGWPAPHVVQRKEPMWLEAADEIERLRAELAAERATTASLLRTIALIREAGGLAREDLDALPDAVKAMREQRDNARRTLCEEWAKDGLPFDWKGRRGPMGMADLLKWDCFKEGGGA